MFPLAESERKRDRNMGLSDRDPDESAIFA